jgi:hypothetical protein
VAELAQKADFLENVLPLFRRLLAQVGHLLDGHDLPGGHVPRVVHGAERAMADFPEVLESFFRVAPLKKLGDFRILQAARPAKCQHHVTNHIFATLRDCTTDIDPISFTPSSLRNMTN